MVGEPQDQPFLRIVQIYVGYFPDAFQAIEQRAPVNEQFPGGLQDIAFMIEKKAERAVQLRIIFCIVFSQKNQLFGAEKLRGEQLKRAISIGFMVIPAIALIIAVLCLLFGFKLTKDKVNQYAAEISARS
ncbi:MAG: hypothetical protein LUD73_03045 [Lachnospiraceae bacterium]|nr:hypothetical protein [Lachnospiraceae bacterium]